MKDIIKSIYIFIYKIRAFFWKLIIKQDDKKILFVSEFPYTMDNIQSNISNLLFKKEIINPKEVKTKKQIKKMLQAKYIFFDNYNINLAIINTKNKTIIQTWHAAGAIKKFGLDNTEIKPRSLSRYQKVYDSYDYYLPASEHMKDVFEKSFNQPESKMLKIGYPKLDIYNKQSFHNKAEKFKQKNDLNLTKLNILYAPTFRDSYEDNLKQIEFVKYLVKELSDNYNIIYKPHPKINLNKIKLPDSKSLIISQNNDLEIYYTTADILITDYSSVIFEYNLINKNILFYLYDFNNYKNNIGLNFDFSKIERNISYNKEDIVNKIKTKNYEEKLQILNDNYYKMYKTNGISREVIMEILKVKNDNQKLDKYMNIK